MAVRAAGMSGRSSENLMEQNDIGVTVEYTCVCGSKMVVYFSKGEVVEWDCDDTWLACHRGCYGFQKQ